MYEAVYSILTLYNVYGGSLPADMRIVVYTDKEELFRKILPDAPIIYHPVTTVKIKEWRGEIDFVHRVKIKVLQDYFEHYHSPVLYVDTDTCFEQNLDEVFDSISAGTYFMHLFEYKLNSNDRFVRRIADKVVDKCFTLSDGELRVPAATEMWNAGALGLPTGEYLQTVLELTDAMYRVYPKHVMEQLAFSFVLGRVGMKDLNETIYHYWDFKEFRTVLERFFISLAGNDLNTLLNEMVMIDPVLLSAPKVAFKKLPGWKRTWLKLIGKGWKL